MNYKIVVQKNYYIDKSQMEWIEPLYGRKKVAKAGKVLIDKSNPNISENIALEVLGNWRGSHAFPLNSIQNSVRYRAKQIDENCVITQRLKRILSIKNKLLRFPDMNLARMQDLGGCRAIMPNINDIYLLKDTIPKARSFSIIKEYDYIKFPKNTGYRGIHLIANFCGKEQYKGLKIEIQIRSYIQHCWATAVEIIGTFKDQQLKSGIGDNKWLEFFRMASFLMESLEIEKEVDEKYIQQAKKLDKELKVRENLITYSVLTNVTTELEKQKGIFLLQLEPESSSRRIINIKHFTDKERTKAIEIYNKTEQNHIESDIVLVEAESINDLKKGYPNYFADSEEFIKCLNFFLE